MTDLLTCLQALHRPRLLIRAARFSACEYGRSRRLPRLLGMNPPEEVTRVLSRLIDIENIINQSRLDQDATYCVSRHIEVLAAMMAEARHLKTDAGPQMEQAVALST